jgi:hypothetical protein
LLIGRGSRGYVALCRFVASVDTALVLSYGVNLFGYDFAAQIIADLDRFLVFVGCPVHEVVGLGLEKQAPDLPADHGYQPSSQSCRAGSLKTSR